MSVNNNFQKNANLSLIAHSIWKKPGVSRITLSRDLELYRSTVSNLVTTLVEHGLVAEGGTGSSHPQGGRKPISLHIDPGFACALGLEIQPDRWVARLVDLHGSVLLAREGEPASTSLTATFDSIIERLEPEIRGFESPLLGICVGLPGIVDVDAGAIEYSQPLGLSGFDFRGELASRYRIPVLVENDANCCAWGDLTEERGIAATNFVSVLAELHEPNAITGEGRGVAVGLGLALGGRVYYGSRHAAGEFMGIYRAGEGAKTRFDGDDGITDDFILELMGQLLPVAAAFDPEAIFMHGALSPHRDRVLALLEDNLPSFAAWLGGGVRRLTFPREEEPVARGAASLFLQRFFAVPELGHGGGSPGPDWDRVFSDVLRGGETWRAGQ